MQTLTIALYCFDPGAIEKQAIGLLSVLFGIEIVEKERETVVWTIKWS